MPGRRAVSAVILAISSLLLPCLATPSHAAVVLFNAQTASENPALFEIGEQLPGDDIPAPLGFLSLETAHNSLNLILQAGDNGLGFPGGVFGDLGTVHVGSIEPESPVSLNFRLNITPSRPNGDLVPGDDISGPSFVPLPTAGAPQSFFDVFFQVELPDIGATLEYKAAFAAGQGLLFNQVSSPEPEDPGLPLRVNLIGTPVNYGDLFTITLSAELRADVETPAVPEPASFAIMAGLVSLTALTRRKRRAVGR